jgi:hypothetical protein
MRSATFEERQRMTHGEAMSLLVRPSNAIEHLMDNGDGSYSIVFHIVCEHCDYCDAESEAWGKGEHDPEAGKWMVHAAKEDIYERQRAAEMGG